MSYFFVNSLHLQRVNVFEFRGNEHGCDSDHVKVTDFHSFLTELEKPILERNSEEKCLIVTSEVGEHLNHPVDHSGSQSRSYFVAAQAVVNIVLVLVLELTQVLVNIIVQLVPDIDVLSLDVV